MDTQVTANLHTQTCDGWPDGIANLTQVAKMEALSAQPFI